MKTTETIQLAALTGLVQAQFPIGNPGIGDFYPNLQRALQLTGEQWIRVASVGNALQDTSLKNPNGWLKLAGNWRPSNSARFPIRWQGMRSSAICFSFWKVAR